MACTAPANIIALSTRRFFKGCARWIPPQEKHGKKDATMRKYNPSEKRALDSFKMLMLLLMPCFY